MSVMNNTSMYVHKNTLLDISPILQIDTTHHCDRGGSFYFPISLQISVHYRDWSAYDYRNESLGIRLVLRKVNRNAPDNQI